jgi:hypothetical protein
MNSALFVGEDWPQNPAIYFPTATRFAGWQSRLANRLEPKNVLQVEPGSGVSANVLQRTEANFLPLRRARLCPNAVRQKIPPLVAKCAMRRRCRCVHR